MADFGSRNSTTRAKWYSDVFAPLGRLVKDVGAPYRRIGKAAKWNDANLVALHLQGNDVGQGYYDKITANWKAVAEAVQVEYKTDKAWGDLTKAKAFLADLQAQAAAGGVDGQTPPDLSDVDPADVVDDIDEFLEDDLGYDPDADPGWDDDTGNGDEDEGMSTGVKIGLAVGGVAVVGLVLAVVLKKKPAALAPGPTRQMPALGAANWGSRADDGCSYCYPE